MAREFIDSFETGSLDLWKEKTSYGLTIVSTVGLNMKGDYCLYVTGNAYVYLSLDTFSEKYFAFMFRIKTNGSYIFEIRETLSYNLAMRIIHFSSSNNLGVYTLHGIGTKGPVNTIYTNTTYFIQFYYKRHNTDGRFVIKINGAPYINFTGATDLSYITNAVCLGSSYSTDTYYDNFVMDNSEMPVETEIVVLRPTGSGTYTNFAPTPSGNANYACVDEIPYNDSDYVGSSVENTIDTYCIGDLPSDTAIVNCVQLQSRAMKDFGATLSGFNFVLRSNDTDYHDSYRVVTETMSNFRNMYLYGPTGSGVWHKTYVDSLEIGVRARA